MHWKEGKAEDYTEHLQQRELAGEPLGALLLEAITAESNARFAYVASVHKRSDDHTDLFKRWTLLREFIEAAQKEMENE